jgi:hypothetical protein
MPRRRVPAARVPAARVPAARVPAALLAVILAAVVAACATSTPSASPTQAPPPTPTLVPTAPGATAAPSDLPAGPPPGPAAYADAPTGCLGLDAASCDAVKAAAADLVGDREVIYVEVGPFGCPIELPCPTTLEARPAGEIVIETADGAPPISAAVRWDGTTVEVTGQQPFHVVVPAASEPAVTGSVPFTLGHCGLLSGIDLDGSWWDPVGFVDNDHPDAINAAHATVTAIDDDHAALRTAGGLAVQLVRRTGPKALRPCM